MTGRRTGTRSSGRPDVVGRLLRSMAFRRSREASSAILDDPDELRDLTESVRDRGYSQGSLEPVAEQIDAALNLLDDRADRLDAGDAPAHLPPPQATRHRLVVAAMHYLARRDDVIEDGSPQGDIDDIVVVREVLDTAEPCLAPFRDDDAPADVAADDAQVSRGEFDVPGGGDGGDGGGGGRGPADPHRDR